MPSIKERIEQNLVVWLLTTLLTGFGAGMGAYRTIQEIGGLTPVSKSRYVDLQKKVETLEAELTASNADSTAAVYADGTSGGSVDGSDLAALNNIRVHIVHLPSQAAAAARLAGEIEDKGAITSTFATNYDRSYWSINTKKESEKGLFAAVQIKSAFPELGALPLRQKTSEDVPYDVVIWLSGYYK